MVFMQIIRKALNRNLLIVRPETINDIYILSLIITPGDLVYSITTRRIRRKGVQGRSGEEGERKTLGLWLRVESVEFTEAQGKGILYLKGNIAQGPEEYIAIGDSHSFGIKIDQNIKIRKVRWTKFHLEKLNNAVEATQKSRIGLIAMEKGFATLAILDNYNLKIVARINKNIPRKLSDHANRNKVIHTFFEKILKIMRIKFTNLNTIFIGGPGKINERFVNFLKNKSLSQIDNIQTENISSGKINGIYELSEKNSVRKSVKNHQTIQISRLIEEFETKLITNPELITYGDESVFYADMCGAIDKILVVDTRLRHYKSDAEKIQKLVASVEKKGGKVIIVNSNTKNGEIIQKFGGIIAFLRYSLPDNI